MDMVLKSGNYLSILERARVDRSQLGADSAWTTIDATWPPSPQQLLLYDFGCPCVRSFHAAVSSDAAAWIVKY